jgi:cytochrome c peroxidase
MCRSAVLVLVLVLVGCGDADDASSVAGTSTGAGESDTASPGSSSPVDTTGEADDGTEADAGTSTGADGDPEPTPDEWDALLALRYDEGPPPPDVTNAWADDPDAASLGHALFFDPRFAGPLLDGDNDGSPGTLGVDGEPQRVSCAGCHVPEDGFNDTRSPHQQISLAAGWVLRKTPTLLDVGFASLLTWDGRRDTMYGVLFGVVENTRELNSSRLFYAQQIFAHHREAYEAVFGPMPDLADTARFGEPLAPEAAGCLELDAPAAECNGKPGDEGPFDALAPEDRDAVTGVVVSAGKALGAYMRRLRCGPSRLDAWLDGDDTALTPAEKRGALLFVGEAGCDDCHGGPMLTDFAFHNVGLMPATVAVVFIDDDDPGAYEGIAAALDDPLSSLGTWSDGNDGRLPSAVDRTMLGAFKTPSLRCVDMRPAFMHTGQYRTLEEVVSFFAAGGHPVGYPGQSEIEPLELSEHDRADLVAFLHTLTGAGPDPALLVPPP